MTRPLRSSISQFHTVIWATMGMAHASSREICRQMRGTVGMDFISSASPMPSTIVASAVTPMNTTERIRTVQNSLPVSRPM
ncbi:hypothetical protein GCM10025876_25830 [Demequina litorisediminis]|uniref:Secreted protein n=1 Tax=Demequina litorisediminis TaxID=1849022 RepID=A0ABQ6IF72_9MICO|nr:hypothetical protein GCM10025876_25830 [Demequina litorisediminis]